MLRIRLLEEVSCHPWTSIHQQRQLQLSTCQDMHNLRMKTTIGVPWSKEILHKLSPFATFI